MAHRNILRFLAALVLALGSSLFSQAQLYNQSADIFDEDIARNVEIDPSDGGYVTTGYSRGTATFVSVRQANLAKFDATGNALWSHVYNFGTTSHGNDVESTPDGGFIIAGQVRDPLTGVPSAMLIKTDGFGNQQWAQAYDFQVSPSEAFAVERLAIPTLGAAYLVTGSFLNAANGTLDVFVMLTDMAGNIVQVSEFDTGGNEEGLSVKVAPPSAVSVAPAYVVSGYSDFGAAPGKNVLLFALDPALNMVWGQVYGGPGDEEGRALEISGTGEIFVAGYSNSFSNGGKDILMTQHSMAGVPGWQFIYGQVKDEEAYSLELVSDGTIALAGWTNFFGASAGSGPNKDAIVLKTTMAGILLNGRAYGSYRDDIAYSVKEQVTPGGVNGGVILAGVFGEAPLLPSDDRDIYTVRTNNTLNAPCSKNPKFRQRDINPMYTLFVLPPSSTAVNNPLPKSDPFVSVAQQDRCCSCADLTASFNYSPLTVCAGNAVQFVNTSGCANAFRWLVNGVLVSTATDLNYVFSTPGVYTVTLLASQTGCPGPVSFSTTIAVSCSASPRLEGDLQPETMMLFPNPASERVELQAELGEQAGETALLRVVDLTGRLVMENNYPASADRLQVQLETSTWAEGIYLVEVISGTTRQIQRLVIAR